jgi:hypothetical protein
MEQTILSADKTKKQTLDAAETTRQVTISAAGCDTGYHPGFGDGSGYAAYKSAVDSANKTIADTRYQAEMAKQASHNVARDTMRNAGTGEVQ